MAISRWACLMRMLLEQTRQRGLQHKMSPEQVSAESPLRTARKPTLGNAIAIDDDQRPFRHSGGQGSALALTLSLLSLLWAQPGLR